MNTKSIAIGLVIALVLSVGIASALSNSGGGDWAYYKEIIVKENSGKALTDFQILIELNSANFEFSKAKSDGSDIRFSDANGEELNYWIEEWAFGRTKIWVKVPSIPANGEAKKKMYYGNEKAKSVSDGSATFEFFDDFDSGKLDNWVIRSGDWSIKNGELAGSGTKSGRDTITTVRGFPIDRVVEVDVKHITLGNLRVSGIILGNTNPIDGANGGNDGVRILFFDRGDYMRLDIGEALEEKHKTAIKTQTGIWNHIKYQRLGKNAETNYKAWVNGELKFDVTESLDTSTWKHLGLWVYQNGYAHFDNIRIRKYTAPEPTVTLSKEFSTQKIPSLTITKSASPSTIREGEATTISIRVENTGTGDAKAVEVTDNTIPTGFKIISGSKSASFDEIKPNEYRTYQYTLKATGTGRFVLDPATATYSDDKGNSYSSASNSVTITSEVSSQPIVPPEEEKGIHGFEIVFAIAGLLAVAYLLRRRG